VAEQTLTFLPVQARFAFSSWPHLIPAATACARGTARRTLENTAGPVGRRLVLAQAVNCIRVPVQVTDAVAFCVDEPDGPLKQRGVRISLQ